MPFKNCKHSPIFLSVLIYRMTMIRKCLQLWNVFYIICSSIKLFVLKWNCGAFRSNSLRITFDGFDQRATTYWKPFSRNPSFSFIIAIGRMPAFSRNPSPISLNSSMKTRHYVNCNALYKTESSHFCLHFQHVHTLYLSFFLHGQIFWQIKFTPKNANFSR